MKKRGILILIILMVIYLTTSVITEPHIPNLIRLHVLANSNSSGDQYLKYKVRDEIINKMGNSFRELEDLQDSQRIVQSNLDSVKILARETLEKEGSNYEVQATYGSFDFPTKYYGDFSLPAGRYKALRVIIGEGKGNNWWCVLFPPLCFVEGQKEKSYTQEEIKEIITTDVPTGKVVQIKPAFKIVELINDVKTKIAEK